MLDSSPSREGEGERGRELDSGGSQGFCLMVRRLGMPYLYISKNTFKYFLDNYFRFSYFKVLMEYCSERKVFFQWKRLKKRKISNKLLEMHNYI